MLNQLEKQEQKLKVAQDMAIQNVLKDQKKQKKYEEEMAKIKAEFDETREKDGKVLDEVFYSNLKFISLEN